MSTIYSEKAPQYTLLVAFFNLLALGFVFLFVYLYIGQLPGWWALLIASPLMIWGALSFSNMRFELTDKEFVAWLWPFNAKARYDEITKVELFPHYAWYVGFGMHYFRKTWWFTTRYQECVRIERKGRSAIAFTPQHPKEFAGMLRVKVRSAKAQAAGSV